MRLKFRLFWHVSVAKHVNYNADLCEERLMFLVIHRNVLLACENSVKGWLCVFVSDEMNNNEI